ncbi:MAG TPA: metallophosphoesterase [Candidatus Nitrosocosmicus sp.]
MRTQPIQPHFTYKDKKGHHHKPGKEKRPLGDPVAYPKPFPKFIPPPATNLQYLSLDLDLIIPEEESKAILDSGSLVFHSVGDTGGIHGDDVEKAIADAMDQQISEAQSNVTIAPLFLYHLGDVIYFNGQSYYYNSQFYEPFQNYHAPIFAIPGNHDGDNQARRGDPVDTEPSLFGFMRNFCDTTSNHESPYRATMTQPYVYWTLNTPFATIIGLYSNVDGTLDARGTNEQQQWFQQQVSTAPKDKALIIAVHHPPYSLDNHHGGYPDIEIAIDRIIQSTERIPTIVLSGHVHNYQRFERDLGGKKVPYVVSGAGGYANTYKLLHKIELDENGERLQEGFQTTQGDLKFMNYNDQAPGFLRITIDKKEKTLTSGYFLVPFDNGLLEKNPFDSVTVPW